MILTDEEIMIVNQTAEFDSAIGYARAIEAAILAKIGEPVAWIAKHGYWLEKSDRSGTPLYRIPEIKA